MAHFIVEDLKRLYKGRNSLAMLVVVNVLVFLTINVVDGIFILAGAEFRLWSWLVMPIDLVSALIKFWTSISYQFMHADIRHILFNMLFLVLFGHVLLRSIGDKRFTTLYFTGGLASAGLVLLVYNLGHALGASFLSLDSVLLGASGSVSAIAIAAAVMLPYHSFNLFILGRVPLRYLALGMFIMSTLIEFQINTGGKIGHIGGALWGYFYGRYAQRGIDIGLWFTNFSDYLMSFMPKKQPSRSAPSRPAASSGGRVRTMRPSRPSNTASDQQRMDSILDKLGQSGYESLTKAEKDFLARFGQDKN